MLFFLGIDLVRVCTWDLGYNVYISYIVCMFCGFGGLHFVAVVVCVWKQWTPEPPTPHLTPFIPYILLVKLSRIRSCCFFNVFFIQTNLFLHHIMFISCAVLIIFNRILIDQLFDWSLCNILCIPLLCSGYFQTLHKTLHCVSMYLLLQMYM